MDRSKWPSEAEYRGQKTPVRRGKRVLFSEGNFVPERRHHGPPRNLHAGLYIEALERKAERADGSIIKLVRIQEDDLPTYWKVSLVGCAGAGIRYFATLLKAEQVFEQFTHELDAHGSRGHDAHPAAIISPS